MGGAGVARECTLRQKAQMRTISSIIKSEKVNIGRGYVCAAKLGAWRRVLIEQEAGYRTIFESAKVSKIVKAP